MLSWRLALPPGSRAATNTDIDMKGFISHCPPAVWQSPPLPRNRHKAEETCQGMAPGGKLGLTDFTVLFGCGCNAQGKTSFLPAPCWHRSPYQTALGSTRAAQGRADDPHGTESTAVSRWEGRAPSSFLPAWLQPPDQSAEPHQPCQTLLSLVQPQGWPPSWPSTLP